MVYEYLDESDAVIVELDSSQPEEDGNVRVESECGLGNRKLKVSGHQ